MMEPFQNFFPMRDDGAVFSDQIIVFRNTFQRMDCIGDLPARAGRKGNLIFLQLSEDIIHPFREFFLIIKKRSVQVCSEQFH